MLALLIERLEVDRGPERHLFDLAFADLHADAAADRVGGILERSPGGLQRDQPPDAVRVLLLGQIQRRIGDIQVLLATPPVRQPPHPHLAEHGPKRPAVAGLDRPARDAGRVHHLIQARLADRAQLKLVLNQRSQQLAALALQQILQLCVLKPVGLHALERAHDRIKPLPRAGKGIPAGGLAGRAPLVALKIRCIIPAGQEIIRRRVTFARTGAKVDGHCGHLSWSTFIAQRRPSAPSSSTPARPARRR